MLDTKELNGAIANSDEQILLKYAKQNNSEAHYALWKMYHERRLNSGRDMVLSCVFGLYYLLTSEWKDEVHFAVINSMMELSSALISTVCKWVGGIDTSALALKKSLFYSQIILLKNAKCGESADIKALDAVAARTGTTNLVVTVPYVRIMQEAAIRNRDERSMEVFCKCGRHLGDPVSIYRHGICLIEGIGCQVDYDEAAKAFAELKGKKLDPKDVNVFTKLDYYSNIITKVKAESEGRKHLKEARSIITGDPSKKDFSKVINLYEKAVLYDIAEAKSELAVLYMYRIGNKDGDKNKQMIQYFVDAANAGYSDACLHLADCYMEEIAVEKNELTAVYFLLRAYGLEAKFGEYLNADKIDGLQKAVSDDKEIDIRVRNYVSSYMFYYGIGTNKANLQTAVLMYYDVNSSDINVFTSKVTDFHGTERRTFKYRISEEILKAGIELERGNRRLDDAEKALSRELAKSYYKLALIECPRAAVYLLRLLFDEKNMDFLPLANIIATEWDASACEDSAKAVSMANYLMGMYYEFYYERMPRTADYSDYILGSSYRTNAVIMDLTTRTQKLDKVKACYKNAPRLDDATRRYMWIIGM